MYYRQDKNNIKASCPFCNKAISPAFIDFPIHLSSFSGGKCNCGAVFLVDPSGKNMGQLLIDALLIIGLNADAPSYKYKFKQFSYNIRNNLISKKSNLKATRNSKIIFVRPNMV